MENSNLNEFKPVMIKNKELKNRFVLPPLDMRMSLFDGTVSQNDIEFHRKRSKNVGMDIIGSAFISDAGNTASGSISISRDEDIEGLTLLSEQIHQNDALSIIQLVHAGELTSQIATQGATIVGPSPIQATNDSKEVVQELTRQDIYAVMDQYVDATKRALAAKMDGIEIHGANGFLPQQFMSLRSNHRTDQFGGSLENRLRFVRILIQKLTNVISQFGGDQFILGYRLSPEEFEDGGLTLRDTLVLAKNLEKLGIDYVSLSLHDFEKKPETITTNFSISEIFKAALDIPIMVAGKINSKEKIELALKSGDLIGIGRPLIIDTDWIRKVCYNQTPQSKTSVIASDIGVAQKIYKYL